MFFLIVAEDCAGADVATIRNDLKKAHVDQLVVDIANKIVLNASAVMDDSGKNIVGSTFVLDVPTRKDAEAWVAAEPFGKGGVWATITIRPLMGAVRDGKMATSNKS